MSLTVTYSEIQRSVARRLGYPLASANRSVDEQQSIDDAVRTAMRWFYFPAGEMAHEWSFLRRYYSITLQAGQNWYELPSDYERIASTASVSINDHPLKATTEDGIRLRISGENLSGVPEYCAVRNMQIEGDTRYEFGVYPTPDATSTLSFWYLFSPDQISETNPEPLGGAVHADTIMLGCLAAAEIQMNPELMAGESSVHYQLFNEKLAAAVLTDRIQLGAL